MKKIDAKVVEGALARAIDDDTASPVQDVAHSLKLSRATVNKYLREMIKRGEIAVTGSGTRGRNYQVKAVFSRAEQLEISSSLDETRVWNEFISPNLTDLDENERGMCAHGFTEMVNNVIDHSDGKRLTVFMKLTPGKIFLGVEDDGIGIFNKIATALELATPAESLLELSKGKFTTDPSKHSGEGIFFTSRMFDEFTIRSGNLVFRHEAGEAEESDWIWETELKPQPGTAIWMSLKLPSTRTAVSVFDKYRLGEPGSGFARTIIPLQLAKIGDEFLVSRSQARRVLVRANRFREVVLDFLDVDSIGQAFADEIFRVFLEEHPEVHLTPVRCNPQVAAMIQHARYLSPEESKRTVVGRFRNLIGYTHFNTARIRDISQLPEDSRQNIENRAQALYLRRRAPNWNPPKVTLHLQDENNTVGIQGDITFAASPDEDTKLLLKNVFLFESEAIFDFQMLGGSLEFSAVITRFDTRPDGFLSLEILQTGPYTKEPT